MTDLVGKSTFSPGYLLKGIGDEEHDQREDNEVRIEKDENACVIETPLAAQASAGLRHAPGSDEEREDVPGRAVQPLDVRKSGHQKACYERSQREDDSSNQ